jgi:predicted nucleic acid-binding protein
VGAKPSVYLDANILSVLHQRRARGVLRDHQLVTREWWEQERRFFQLYSSVRTESELAAGKYSGQAEALAEVRRLRFLVFSGEVRDLALSYLEEQIVPASSPGDAYHLAFAAVHMIDYLMTWNQAHLLNVETWAKLKALHERTGLYMPWLVSPKTIPRVWLGQVIRRPKNAT